MASDPSFVAHALDLVALLGGVEARRMFGGHGLYAGGVMFGLLDDGELFLKTDAESRARFAAAGCRQWTYVHGKVRMEETSYFRPPDDAHEDPEAMLPWARLARAARARTAASIVLSAAAFLGIRTRLPPGTPAACPRGSGARRRILEQDLGLFKDRRPVAPHRFTISWTSVPRASSPSGSAKRFHSSAAPLHSTAT